MVVTGGYAARRSDFVMLTCLFDSYLCYGTDTIQFVPIAVVKARYDYDINHRITTKDAINRDLSKTFLDAVEASYNIQNILTYGST